MTGLASFSFGASCTERSITPDYRALGTGGQCGFTSAPPFSRRRPLTLVIARPLLCRSKAKQSESFDPDPPSSWQPNTDSHSKLDPESSSPGGESIFERPHPLPPLLQGEGEYSSQEGLFAPLELLIEPRCLLTRASPIAAGSNWQRPVHGRKRGHAPFGKAVAARFHGARSVKLLEGTKPLRRKTTPLP